MKARLHQSLSRFDVTSLLVVGDVMVDEFVLGEVQRISREAPVPILEWMSHRQVPGGAANAAANAASLGGRVTVAGLIGADGAGDSLRTLLMDQGMDTSGLLVDPLRPTTVKTRISATSKQSVTQQVVRLDRLSRAPMDAATELQLIAFIEARIPDVDAVLISDYESGVVTPPVIAAICAAAHRHGKILAVDSQADLGHFQAPTIVTPNQPEAERVVGYTFPDVETLTRGGREILARSQATYVLITRGAEGMALFGADGQVTLIPAYNRSAVFDVTGAGDTVV
ncbi:MAG: bifunctional hydroxymethylpyrimidine kinase/phosphomethylpyrimidine kinase, partial [Candidatus Sericytochromatia bacterium]|nr:bifunctional hydroxymethylpyrimidine kinase/phosphomethylpyrimidine kinase [Candidatus Sericytochromatia bacterium]